MAVANLAATPLDDVSCPEQRTSSSPLTARRRPTRAPPRRTGARAPTWRGVPQSSMYRNHGLVHLGDVLHLPFQRGQGRAVRRHHLDPSPGPPEWRWRQLLLLGHRLRLADRCVVAARRLHDERPPRRLGVEWDGTAWGRRGSARPTRTTAGRASRARSRMVPRGSPKRAFFRACRRHHDDPQGDDGERRPDAGLHLEISECFTGTDYDSAINTAPPGRPPRPAAAARRCACPRSAVRRPARFCAAGGRLRVARPVDPERDDVDKRHGRRHEPLGDRVRQRDVLGGHDVGRQGAHVGGQDVDGVDGVRPGARARTRRSASSSRRGEGARRPHRREAFDR